MLIVNADDWGRDRRTTDMILDCVIRDTVSSVSAMVFMEDSDRAACVAREHGIDSGLHLNFTTPFSGSRSSLRLSERQQDLARYLRGHRLAQVVFNPTLSRSFEYVVKAQLDEFRHLYGADAERLDGHHHMHLCANVLIGKLLPSGSLVRRNFSFETGERSVWNRLYRRSVDRVLSRRHRLLDYLYSLAPLEPPDRLRRILSLARHSFVELETHPASADEYRFLTAGQLDWRQSVAAAAASAAVVQGSGF